VHWLDANGNSIIKVLAEVRSAIKAKIMANQGRRELGPPGAKG